MPTTHIVGAGVSGLACAVRLAKRGMRVVLHESAGHAGGRCRSYHDDHLDRTIDNGNHLLLSGNTAVRDYLAAIGASDELTGPPSALFPFVDLAHDLRWTVKVDPGRVPLWVFRADRRLPGTGILDYLKALRLLGANADQSLMDVLDTDSEIFRRFWEPFAVGVLNTPAEQAAAQLLGRVLRETFGRGGDACMPRMARRGLSQTFVDPALAYIGNRGAEFRTGQRLRRIAQENERVSLLHFGDHDIALDKDDRVVLAVPPQVAASLLPQLKVPTRAHPIVNAHFRLSAAIPAPEDAGLLGVIGGTAHWVFFRDDVVSVTVSAADYLAQQSAEEIAGLIWCDLCRAVAGISGDLPDRYRIVKERRATFSQTPTSIRDRPDTDCGIAHLFLAGDWTNTGLPATIEGSIRSGNAAADAVLTQ